jgi:hypothetical protein
MSRFTVKYEGDLFHLRWRVNELGKITLQGARWNIYISYLCYNKQATVFSQTNHIIMRSDDELFIKMVLDNWNNYVKRTDDLFNELSDEQLNQTVSPGRNRGVYLLGHLAAVHDRMLPLLGFEKQRFPELEETFVTNPDNSNAEMPGLNELKKKWKEVNEVLSRHFQRLKPEEWFQRHNAVSEVDFEKEPHRNKLNVVINRAGHLASHYGQLLFLRSREG